MSLASVVYGGRRVADAEAEGELTLTGDRQLFDRFVTWFPLPEKIGWSAAGALDRMSKRKNRMRIY